MGILLLITKIWDAVNDPIIGAIVDTIAGGGHNFATLAARAAVEEKTAAFIKANL